MQTVSQRSLKMAYRICYGYTTVTESDLIINEKEANSAHLVFALYLGGNSLSKIAGALEQQGILLLTGKARWNREAIPKLLSNQKYTGFVLLQKTLNIAGTQFQNDGELKQVFIKVHRESIISVDFEKMKQIGSTSKII